MSLLLIDGIGPFFRDDRRTRINWSKIPFDALECDSADRLEIRQRGIPIVVTGRQ